MPLSTASRWLEAGYRFAARRGSPKVVRCSAHRRASNALRALVVALSTSVAGVSAWAAAPPVDPALADRLARIEDLAKAHPERAQAALVDLDADRSLPANPNLRLRIDLLRAWIANSAGDTQAALRRLDALQPALDATGDAGLSARALSLRANVLNDLNRFVEMGETVRAERREAERAGDEGLLVTADIDRAWHACQTGDYAEGVAAILSARMRSKSRRQSAETAQATALLANMVDDTQTALSSAQFAAQVYREIDDPIGESEALVMVAASQKELGRPRESEAAARRALEMRRLGNDRLGQAIALTLLAAAQLDQDHVAAAVDSSAQAMALYPPDAKVYLAIARTERARILLLSGRIADARALLASAAAVADLGSNRGLRLSYHEQLGRAAIAVGDFRLARGEDRIQQGLRREHTQGSVERQLGALRVRLEQEALSRDNAMLRDKAALTARATRMTEMALCLGLLLLVGLAWAYARQSHLTRRLEAMTQTDALTGLLNRRGLFDSGSRCLERCRHEAQPFVVLIFDIDHFKRINDEFGHRAGDDALASVARSVLRSVRPGDQVGRYGGEEFAVLLPGTRIAPALAAAERIRRAVETLEPTWHERAQRITISAGLAADGGRGSFEQLVESADRALYRAKALGRNRIEWDGAAGVTS